MSENPFKYFPVTFPFLPLKTKLLIHFCLVSKFDWMIDWLSKPRMQLAYYTSCPEDSLILGELLILSDIVFRTVSL